MGQHVKYDIGAQEKNKEGNTWFKQYMKKLWKNQ